MHIFGIFYSTLYTAQHDGFDQESTIAPLHESCKITTIPKQRVSFGAFVAVREVLSRKNYTSEELGASWFDLDDICRMRKTEFRAKTSLPAASNKKRERDINEREMLERTLTPRSF